MSNSEEKLIQENIELQKKLQREQQGTRALVYEVNNLREQVAELETELMLRDKEIDTLRDYESRANQAITDLRDIERNCHSLLNRYNELLGYIHKDMRDLQGNFSDYDWRMVVYGGRA